MAGRIGGAQAAARGVHQAVSLAFVAVCLWIGWGFVRFYFSCPAPTPTPVSRPPDVEAFLPISTLMSDRDWLQTGSSTQFIRTDCRSL